MSAPALRDLLNEGREMLAEAGVETPALDARLLLMAATGLDHAALIVADTRDANEDEEERFLELIDARADRVPVAYLLGEKEFWGRSFAVDPSVLIPRPETEQLVERALRFLPPPAGEVDGRRPDEGGKRLSILDLGTGSGAILVSLLAERPNLWGVGVDRSYDAIEVARANAIRHGVAHRAAFVVGDWSAPIGGAFDLVVANPPYLTNAELEDAQPELHAEPALALSGGEDGLAAYRAIAAALPLLLKPGGVALLEIGYQQGVSVAALLAQAGLEAVAIHLDLSGKDRLAEARNPQQGERLIGPKKGLESEIEGANVPPGLTSSAAL